MSKIITELEEKIKELKSRKNKSKIEDLLIKNLERSIFLEKSKIII